MPLVEKYWGGWKAGHAAEVKIPAEPAPRIEPGCASARMAAALPYILTGAQQRALAEILPCGSGVLGRAQPDLPFSVITVSPLLQDQRQT